VASEGEGYSSSDAGPITRRNVMPSTIVISLAALGLALTGAVLARYLPVKEKKWSLQQSRVSDQWLADHKRGRT
jgi:hypothetical protein